MSLYSTLSIQRARKEYKCDACGKPIKKGEKYLKDYWHGVGTYRYHIPECAEKVGFQVITKKKEESQ